MKKSPIHILFGATSDYLQYAVVTAKSAVERANGRPVKIHFLYADIVKPISDTEREAWFDMARHTFNGANATIDFYDISDKVHMFDGQNVGMWGPEISKNHYFYLLAPLVLPDTVDKVIYLDTDMIVNCDLGDAYDTGLGDYLIAMGAPRGFEEMGDDVSNSGFSIINLNQWRIENTLDKLLTFGKTLPRFQFCDQYLLYQYFTKNNSNRMMLLDARYNIFPQCSKDIEIADIKILHYTGYNSYKAWADFSGKQRGSYLWWYYVRQTAFYEKFIINLVATEIARFIPKKTKHTHSIWWHLRHMQF